MSNTTDLLNKLLTIIPIYGRILNPRCLVFDNHGYLVTISLIDSTLVQFNATDMTIIDQTNLSFNSSKTLSYNNGNYFVGFRDRILVIDSENLTEVNNITSTNLIETRDMMFLNNGRTLVVTSTNNKYLLFFNRSSIISTDFYPVYEQSVSYTFPHGLLAINDTFFYATSWAYNTVYSYSAISGNNLWKESLILDGRSISTWSYGSHITIDDCGRFWYSLGPSGVVIYDKYGSFLGLLSFPNSMIFATVITDNYIIYLSDEKLNRTIRINPNIQC
ncbi:hypothetical protein I4U23_029386 [Adineta vaga]|nr:hypothetical protein I4U23_029386 [Adineta vaga]